MLIAICPLIYNTSLVKTPPQSFGELQDAKYLSQIAICDPQTSGLGRSMLFWSVALFGTQGYEHLLEELTEKISIKHILTIMKHWRP